MKPSRAFARRSGFFISVPRPPSPIQRSDRLPSPVLPSQPTPIYICSMSNEIKFTNKETGTTQVATLPINWDDCDLAQALNAYNILHLPLSPTFTTYELPVMQKMRLLMVMFKSQDEGNIINFNFFDDWMQELCDEHGDEDGKTIFYNGLDEMLECLDGFFQKEEDEEGNIRVSIANNFLQLPLDKIKLDRTLLKAQQPKRKLKFGKASAKKNKNLHLLYPPSDYFATSSFLELKAAFEAYEAYSTAVQEEGLEIGGNKVESKLEAEARLIATLFRPQKSKIIASEIDPQYRGQIRVDFNGYEMHIAHVAQSMKTVDRGMRQLIVFWIGCTLNWIAESYPDLFPKRSESDSHDPAAWGKLMLALSDSPQLKDLNEVANMPYMNTFEHIRQQNEKARKLEEAARKNN